jgi:PTS system mannose-specific IIB component
MPIVLVRIDDRLIHGQIVEGWLKIIKVNHIVVISDEVAKNKMQQILLGMAVPNNIKVSNFSIEDAARKIRENIFDKDRALLLLSCPQDVVRLIEQGVQISSINVGGMHFAAGKKQVLRNLSVNEDDIAAFRAIGGRNIELEGRVLPSDERINIIEVIDRESQNGQKND